MVINKNMLARIFFVCMVLVTVHIEAYAKSENNETNISAVQNVQQDNQDVESNTNTTKMIIGRVEKVRITPGNIIFKSRIDTGATTTSLGVDEMQIVNEDGKDWVEVRIDDLKLKFKVRKYIYIKQHGAKSKKRPVIRLRLTLGNISEIVNVTLADRSNFKYQLLIGRNYLYDHFMVDVSLKNTVKPQEYKEQ